MDETIAPPPELTPVKTQEKPITFIDHRLAQTHLAPSLDTRHTPQPTISPTASPEVAREQKLVIPNKDLFAKNLDLDIDKLRVGGAEQNQTQRNEIKDKVNEYLVTFQAPLSDLLANISSENSELIQEVTQDLIAEKTANRQLFQDQIESLLSGGDRGSTETPAIFQIVDISDATVSGTGAGISISGTDKNTLLETKALIADSWDSVLPMLLALDSTMALLTNRSPQLSMLIRQVDEMRNGKQTNQAILLNLDVPEDVIKYLQKERIPDVFFSYFKNKKDLLISFFYNMTPTSGNTFSFLEKLPQDELREMVEHKKLPYGIQLEETELDMILSRLRPYERVRLGIRPTENKMI